MLRLESICYYADPARITWHSSLSPKGTAASPAPPNDNPAEQQWAPLLNNQDTDTPAPRLRPCHKQSTPSLHTLFSYPIYLEPSNEWRRFVWLWMLLMRKLFIWQHNIFSPTSGMAGESFINELSKLFRAYGESSVIEQIALKAAMILPSLILQNPHHGSKHCHHCECLTRHLSLWCSGDNKNLMLEDRAIQYRIQHRKHNNVSHHFSNLMFQGRVKETLKTSIHKREGSATQHSLSCISFKTPITQS